MRLLHKKVKRKKVTLVKYEKSTAGSKVRGELERRLATVLMDSNDAIVLHDFEGNILSWNRGAESIYGYSKEEALGMNILKIIPEDRWAEASTLTDRLREGERIESFETRRLTKDGRFIDVWLTVTPVLDDEGTPMGIATTERDITERRQARKALRGSERNFRELVESLHTGISIYQGGRIVYMNPAYEKLLGPLQGLFDPTHYKYIHPEDVTSVKSFYQGLLLGRSQTDDLEFRFFPVDGSAGRLGMKWVYCRGMRFVYEGKEALLFNFTDTTNKRELDHLMSMQDRMASLGHIAATITHDIRNALSSLNIYLSTLHRLLDRQKGLEKEQGIIEQMRDCSSQIESVIKTATDFSRPGKPNLQRSNMNEIVEETIGLLSTALSKSGVKIVKNLGGDLPGCALDPVLIKRVLVNLIMNALEAMEKMDREIKELEITSSVKNEHIVVRVSDKGPGVPPQLRKKIFDPFFTTKDDSMGIGLTISFRIIQDHGGLLYVTESKWGGAEFVIEFPLESGTGPA
jgi:PAS domain S-box-containing protein